MADEKKTEVAVAPAQAKKATPPEEASRGWVDNSLDAIAAATSKGVSLDSLPHDVQQTVAELTERPVGKRVGHNEAHKLDHVKQAHNFVKGRIAQITAGLG